MVTLGGWDAAEVVVVALKGVVLDVDGVDGAIMLPRSAIEVDDYPELRDGVLAAQRLKRVVGDAPSSSAKLPQYAHEDEEYTIAGFVLFGRPQQDEDPSKLAANGRELELMNGAESDRVVRRRRTQASETVGGWPSDDEEEEGETSDEEGEGMGQDGGYSFRFYTSSRAPCCIELAPTIYCRFVPGRD